MLTKFSALFVLVLVVYASVYCGRDDKADEEGASFFSRDGEGLSDVDVDVDVDGTEGAVITSPPC